MCACCVLGACVYDDMFTKILFHVDWNVNRGLMLADWGAVKRHVVPLIRVDVIGIHDVGC